MALLISVAGHNPVMFHSGSPEQQSVFSARPSTVFTVRSSTALTPLPAGGIWCDNSGKVKQQSVFIVFVDRGHTVAVTAAAVGIHRVLVDRAPSARQPFHRWAPTSVFTVCSSTALTSLPAGGSYCDHSSSGCSGKVDQQSVFIVRSSTVATPLP